MNQEQVTNQIYQIDNHLEIIEKFDSVTEIVNKFQKPRESFDQALRIGYKAFGFFWFWEKDWNKGLRPDFNRQQRNVTTYVYKYSEDYNPNSEKVFIGRYKSAVVAADDLNISVSNIREVLKGNKLIHRNYYFSEHPLNVEDDNLADIQVEDENKFSYNKYLQKRPRFKKINKY